MPNIEIHGMLPERADALRIRIAKLLSRAECRDDVVVSILHDLVVDLKGQPQPYLRVFTDRTSRDSEEIKQCLRILNLDIEMLDLREFVRAKILAPTS